MKASCSITLHDSPNRIPATLIPYGELFKLHLAASNKYVGLFESTALNQISSRFRVKLVAIIRNCKDNTKKKRSLKSIEIEVEVVIYSIRSDADAIGNFLSDDELYLQHPTDYDSRFPYFNPQYLLRPGAEMPRAQDAGQITSSDSSSGDDVLNEKRTIQMLQVFNHANGPLVFSKASESPRLVTSLQE
jgi:hypothetical protein